MAEQLLLLFEDIHFTTYYFILIIKDLRLATKISRQCKCAVYLFCVNALQLGKRSEEVLHARR